MHTLAFAVALIGAALLGWVSQAQGVPILGLLFLLIIWGVLWTGFVRGVLKI